ARDFIRFEPTQRTERQRNLRLDPKRRMAAGKDQPQPVVGYLAKSVILRLLNPRPELRAIQFDLFLKPRPPPDRVYSLVARRLDDPRARKFRHSRRPPLVHRTRKRFLRNLFGKLE